MNKLLTFLLLFLASSIVAANSPDRAAIASAHPMATQAGQEILEQGGNAFDAAVAIAAALAVVEPQSSGLGGGAFFLLNVAESGRQVFVDAREVAPGAATEDMYLQENGDPIPRASVIGPLSAGIPGQPAGLVHLSQKYGRLPLAASLAPAIRYAEQGTVVNVRMLAGLRFRRKTFDLWPAFGKVFYPEGEIPELGAVIKQPDLMNTLERLAEDGFDGFYRGETARLLVDAARASGGIWSRDDLATYQVIEREPIIGEINGVRIVSAPPPSSGGITLINMLNILQGFDFATMDSATRKHLTIEAMRRAFRDRAEYLGDPDFVSVPVARLVSPFYAAGQRASIRSDKATSSDALPGVGPVSKGDQTTHFSVIDKDGNRVAGTMSINLWYGSGFMAPGTGVIFNNEMDDFSIKLGVLNSYDLIGTAANSIEPGKRPLSSMTPTFLESDRGGAILGTPGGSRIITMVLQAAMAWMEGADAAGMVSLKRFHHQFYPDVVIYEEGALTMEEQQGLEQRGHQLKKSPRAYGNMNIVTWDAESGKVEAATDPRGISEGRVY